MYLMHWPIASEEIYSGVIDGDYLDMWKAMEKLVDEGLIKKHWSQQFQWGSTEEIARKLQNQTFKHTNRGSPVFAQPTTGRVRTVPRTSGDSLQPLR